MLVVDLMTREVVTVSKDAPVSDALKIMQEHDFRRLPVIDEDGRPAGVVSRRSIESLRPQSGLTAIFPTGGWASRRVGEVMRKKLVTVRPTDTVEFATAKAQSAKVGTLLVVEDAKIVGVVTTNDIFYRVVNPTLGIGEPGTRVVIVGGGTGEHAAKIISIINKMGINIRILWGIFSPNNNKTNLVVHLDTDDARNVICELAGFGYTARTVNR